MSSETGVRDWIRPGILALKQYQAAHAERGQIKLDAMENPWPLPEPLRAAWEERIARVLLNRYPDPGAHALAPLLRRVMGIPKGMELLLGNGSDEIIQMLMLSVGGPGRWVLGLEPGFAMFRLTAQATETGFTGVPLAPEDFSLDVEAVLREMAEKRPALVLIANPNNPTGNLFEPEALRAVVKAAPGLVVVDEAYFAFAQRHCMDWLGEYPNLLVMRTLSKLGLAGLRIGFLAGPGEWLEQIGKVRLPYNVNVLSQASGVFALEHYETLREQAAAICRERVRLYESLEALPGVKPYPSQANFVLFHVTGGSADGVHKALKASGILIKNLHGSHESLLQCLRVTAGTPEENTLFLEALSHALKAD